MKQKYSKEDALKNSIKAVLNHQNIEQHQDLITRLAMELNSSVLECAAALSLINEPELYISSDAEEKVVGISSAQTKNQNITLPKQRVVRYRLDVGLKHQVQADEIKTVLVEVSGVDIKRITRVDIRNHYTLIELPEGMTADIFQLLSESKIKNKKLNIKRVKFHRRFQRRNQKKR